MQPTVQHQLQKRRIPMRTTRLLLLSILLVLVALLPVHAEEQTFDSNGVKIHYIVEGKGEPVVMIHGVTSRLESWNGLVKTLSPNYRVIALDCRGHGKSDKPH